VANCYMELTVVNNKLKEEEQKMLAKIKT